MVVPFSFGVFIFFLSFRSMNRFQSHSSASTYSIFDNIYYYFFFHFCCDCAIATTSNLIFYLLHHYFLRMCRSVYSRLYHYYYVLHIICVPFHTFHFVYFFFARCWICAFLFIIHNTNAVDEINITFCIEFTHDIHILRRMYQLYHCTLLENITNRWNHGWKIKNVLYSIRLCTIQK